MNPATTMLIGAGIGGIGSYFQGTAEEQAADQQYQIEQQQLQLQQQEWAAQQASKQAASGIISADMSGSSAAPTMDYTNPLAGQTNQTLASMLTGQLTPAQQALMTQTTNAGAQGVNAAAASSGMPAGARAGALASNAANVGTQFGNIASNEMTAGVSGANQAANTGLNVASANNQSSLAAYLNNQQQQNLKAQTLAGYAT